jgi:hypothetical protein
MGPFYIFPEISEILSLSVFFKKVGNNGLIPSYPKTQSDEAFSKAELYNNFV